MTPTEIAKVQKYLRSKFETQHLVVKDGEGKGSPAEVMVGNEFLGVIYRNVDEGEVSYDFNMAILDIDLE